MRVALCGLLLCVGIVPMLSAQDATKVDPKHYALVSENDQVRILKVHYGPHEKSVMHSHPAGVVIFLTDATNKFTFPDGKTQTMSTKAGDAQSITPVTHLPENTTDKGIDLILVELKGKPGMAMKSDMK
jgi:quercetin dioxygenase-like cupin family protein